MVLMINDKAYKMTDKQVKGVLDIAKQEVKKGIYALKKHNIVELRKDVFSSNSKLKAAIKHYKAQGYIVYCNRL